MQRWKGANVGVLALAGGGGGVHPAVMMTKWMRFAVAVLFAAAMAHPLQLLGQSQQEMNRQAEREFDAADKALNQVYKQVLAAIDAEAQPKLKAAQRAWVQFRDADAAFHADLEARDGRMAPLVEAGRKAAMTEARVKELQKVLKDYGD